MGLTAGKGRRVKQIPKKIKRRRTQGKFFSEGITCAGFCSRGLRRRGAASAVPCRRTLPCRRLLPYRKALPCQRALPCRGILPWLLVGLLCFYTNQQTDISKDRVSMHTSQRKANHILTLGAALEESCRVRQGCLGRTPCCCSRFILDDNHRNFGSLCCSLVQSPKKEQV